MKNKVKKNLAILRENILYILSGVAILVLVFIGSRNKSLNNSSSISMDSIAASNYSVSSDQVSEFYMVANMANNMKLASFNETMNNYATVTYLYQDGQISDESGKISKPITVDVSHLSRGVVTYTVQSGETMESIAAKYGVTTDQIRWSNNLKTTALSEGQSILVPTVSGIAYTVKDGDTVESLAQKYGSDASQIISYNDLETDSNLSTGTTILLPSGALPETERPEYVAPTPVYTTPTVYYNSTYIGGSGQREDMTVIQTWSYYASVSASPGNPMTPGQCTWFAWYWRQANGNPLPHFFGNANSWASTLGAMGYAVDHNPSVGAVFQTTAGYYGHVGVVVGVNGDGSITVQEMNWNWRAYVVTQSRIPTNLVGAYYYIH